MTRTAARPVPIKRLLGEFSNAVKAFQDAMTALAIADSVTAFTLSEMGRTFKPASNAGTDHGWGNYAFVIGGAVKGGDFYGTLADAGARTALTTSARTAGGSPRHRSSSMAATLCRWFGIGGGGPAVRASRTSARSRTRTSGSWPERRRAPPERRTAASPDRNVYSHFSLRKWKYR